VSGSRGSTNVTFLTSRNTKVRLAGSAYDRGCESDVRLLRGCASHPGARFPAMAGRCAAGTGAVARPGHIGGRQRLSLSDPLTDSGECTGRRTGDGGPRGGPITGGRVVPCSWRNSRAPQGGPMSLAGDKNERREGRSCLQLSRRQVLGAQATRPAKRHCCHLSGEMRKNSIGSSLAIVSWSSSRPATSAGQASRSATSTDRLAHGHSFG
jgi:hypothetical protein